MKEPLHAGFYEVHLPVTDLARSIRFYVERLGFELAYGTAADAGALLQYQVDGRRWMLGLFVVDTVVHRHPAEYHVAFRTNPESVDALVASLVARGIEPVHPPTAPRRGPMREPIVHGWMPAAAVFFRDPDGHLLELLAELPDPPRPEVVYCPLSAWRALR